MTNNHPDQIDKDIDEILFAFARHYHRYMGMHTDEAPLSAQARAAIKMLMLKEREAEVRKAQMYIPDDEYGHYLRGRIKNLEGEIKEIQGTEGLNHG